MDAAPPDLDAFIRDISGEDRLPAKDADLFHKFGIDGDDASEFMEAFAARFGVDMTGFLWYFHHGEEVWSPLSFVFKPPYMRVKTIPVTIALLEEAIATKRWPVVYPPHTLPERRWDILAVYPFMIAVILAVFALSLWLDKH